MKIAIEPADRTFSHQLITCGEGGFQGVCVHVIRTQTMRVFSCQEAAFLTCSWNKNKKQTCWFTSGLQTVTQQQCSKKSVKLFEQVSWVHIYKHTSDTPKHWPEQLVPWMWFKSKSLSRWKGLYNCWPGTSPDLEVLCLQVCPVVVSRVHQEEHTADAFTEMKSQQGDMKTATWVSGASLSVWSPLKWVVFLSFPYIKAKFFQMIFHKQTLQIVSILSARGFEYLISEIDVSLPVQRSSKLPVAQKNPTFGNLYTVDFFNSYSNKNCPWWGLPIILSNRDLISWNDYSRID